MKYSAKRDFAMKLPEYDTERFSEFLLILLALQPLFGFLLPTPSQTTYSNLFFAKAMIVRFIGWFGLLNAWVYHMRSRKTLLNRFSESVTRAPWNFILFFFFLIATISTLFSYNLSNSVIGYGYRYSGYITYIAYVGIYLSGTMIRNEKYRDRIINVFVHTCGVISVMTLLKEFCGFDFLFSRSGYSASFSGPFLNPNHYGYYLCVGIILAAVRFIDAKKTSEKIFLGIGYITGIITLLYNASLGPILAVIITSVVLILFMAARKDKKKLFTSVVLFVVLVASLFVFNSSRVLGDIKTLVSQIGEINTRIEEVSSGEKDVSELGDLDAGSSRWKIWIGTINLALNNAIVGVGPENVYSEISEYLDGNNKMPHNEYLQIAADMGIIAALLYIAALVWLLVRNIRLGKKLPETVLAAGLGVMAYCISAFTGVEMPICTFALFMLLGLNNAWTRTSLDNNSIK